MKPETVLYILNDVSSFNLGMFGIAITVFTVLYAFILSRKDSLRILNDTVKQGDDSPFLKGRISLFLDHTLKWKRLNFHLKTIIVISLILYLFGIILKYVDCNNCNNIIMLLAKITIILSFINALYIFTMLGLILKNYESSVRLN